MNYRSSGYPYITLESSSLIKSIKICEEYANEHSITFNGNKSKYNPIIQVENETVYRCDGVLHLGHLLHT